MRILLVEDCAPLRFILTSVLQAVGFDVEQAEDGVAALECLERRIPDIVMTDINMPRMNGLEFMEAARKTPHGQNIPIYVFSSDASPAKLKRAAACGVKSWMVKPLDIEQVAIALLGAATGFAAQSSCPDSPSEMTLISAAA